jgi:hypothetical protein
VLGEIMRGILLFLFVSQLVFGCAGISVSGRAIDKSEEKWNDLGIKNYSYTFVIAYLSPEVECADNGSGIDVEVRNGKVSKYGTCSLDAKTAKLFGTINSVFTTLRKEKSASPVSLKVAFNQRYWFPESIDINYSRWRTDYRVQYYIRNFGVLSE